MITGVTHMYYYHYHYYYQFISINDAVDLVEDLFSLHQVLTLEHR